MKTSNFSMHVTKNISAYCHGELSPEESRQFSEHVLACTKCRTQFEEIKLGIKFAEQLPQLSAPESLWADLESKLGTTSSSQTSLRRSFFRAWQTQVAAAAAILLFVAVLGIWWMRREQPPVNSARSWEVKVVNGKVRVGSEDVSGNARLAVGEWLETEGDSCADVTVSSIGHVEIQSNTRIRLVETKPTEHRLELERGKLSARIWAPPRLFFVDTPSAVAADIGCAYTLEVDDNGASMLRVTSGWVALELKDRESMVQLGQPVKHVRELTGTPYFEDSAPEFRQSLKKVDFDSDPAIRKLRLRKC